jgi:flagellar basal-body rod protein FlgG
MIEALNIAATGMQVHQSTLETVAGNITNANTPGYKRARVNFTDLLVKESARATDAAATDGMSPALTSRASSGVSATGVSRAFDQGELRKTGRPSISRSPARGSSRCPCPTAPEPGRAAARCR